MMNFARTFSTVGRLAAIVSCVVLWNAPTWARSSFSVSPTRVFLTPRSTSALLTLRNEASEPLRFQLSVFAWKQSPSGEMLLTPSEDLIYFPRLVELKPSEVRKVRVGATQPFGAIERAYRIFVEELPALTAVGQQPAAGVNMRTRMGIPIFMAPAKASARGVLSPPSMERGRVSVRLDNQGTAHFIADTVRVIGQTANGTETFNKVLNGWYTLAGEGRTFEFSLTEIECRSTATIAAEGKIGARTLHSQAALDAIGCAPGR